MEDLLGGGQDDGDSHVRRACGIAFAVSSSHGVLRQRRRVIIRKTKPSFPIFGKEGFFLDEKMQFRV